MGTCTRGLLAAGRVAPKARVRVRVRVRVEKSETRGLAVFAMRTFLRPFPPGRKKSVWLSRFAVARPRFC